MLGPKRKQPNFKELEIGPGLAAVTGLAIRKRRIFVADRKGILPPLAFNPRSAGGFRPPTIRPGAPETVILSGGYWKRRFGGNLGGVGRDDHDRFPTARGDRHDARGFLFKLSRESSEDLILPLQLDLASRLRTLVTGPWHASSRGVSVAQANADVGRMLPLFREKDAGDGEWTRSTSFRPCALSKRTSSGTSDVLWVLLGRIGIVLLIACANVANLLLVRAEGRARNRNPHCTGRRMEEHRAHAHRREPDSRSDRRPDRPRLRLRRAESS